MGDDDNRPTATSRESEDLRKIRDVLSPSGGNKLNGNYIFLNIINNLLSNLKGLISPFSSVQNAAADLARTVGLSSKSIMAISTRTVDQNRRMALSSAYNVTSDDIIKLQNSLITQIGRNVTIDMVGRSVPGNENYDSEIANILSADKIFGPDRLAKIVAGFDKIGKSMGTAAKYTGKLYQEAGEYGISLQKYSENFMENLSMVQMYNFKNGINGLREMARKATEIRQSMKDVASFADKVGTVTGAIETAASLQVLGGSFTALANPLAMLNESLTNIEGLQNRLTEMTAGAAHYNSVTKQIEMDPLTRMRMKRAAEVMGVDASTLIDQAYAQARRTEIKSQLGGIGNLIDGFEKLAVNIGTIDEYGRAGVTNKEGKFMSFAEIAAMDADKQKELQDQLIMDNRSQSDDIKDIALNVRTIEEIISGRQKQLGTIAESTIIERGPLGRQPINDIVYDLATLKFSPEAMEAFGKIDSYIVNFKGFESAIVDSAILDFGKTINNFTNPEEFKKSLKEAFESTFGDSDLVTDIANFLSSVVGESLSNVMTNLGGFIKENTNGYINPLQPFENGIPGIAGSTFQIPEATNNAYSDISGIKSGVDEIVSSLPRTIENGGNESITVESSETVPIAMWGQPENKKIYQNTLFENNTQEVKQPFNGYGFENSNLLANRGIDTNPLELLNAAIENAQSNIKLFVAPNSVPSIEVLGGGTRLQNTANYAQPGNGRQNGQYNLNLTGNLTVNVVGDNGKANTYTLEQIINAIDKSRHLKRELGMILTKAVNSMETSSGQNNNFTPV